jgi:hypothetical protein
VKYIAKSAAKNMSSLASQTIVPIETMLGRFAGAWSYAWGITVVWATGILSQIGN